jgi:hypothetical protein
VAFQFAHVETYSIKGSATKSGGAGIAAEAGRTPANSRHVAEPKPPVLLAGVEPDLAWLKIVESRGKARDLWTQKSGVKAERKLRTDAHILLAAVASHPEPTATCDIESPDFKDWLNRSIEFFTKEHGEPLSVVMHLDETHPHIHFLTAPNLADGQRMPDIHVGVKAVEDVGGKNAKKHVKKKAFGDAMRVWQDRYQESVGVYHGLARLGPQRRRLPTGAYKAEQAEAKRQAEQLRKLEVQTETVTTASAQLDQRETAAAAAQAAIEKANAELATRQTEIAAREAATAAARSKIDTATGELEARELAVSAAQVEVEQLKKQLGEREQTVAQAQAQVTEAEKGLGEREAAVSAAQEGVDEANRKLDKRRNNLKNTKERLDARIAHVSQREQRLSGVWGAFVSAITLGKAGTKQRIKQAVEAVKADFAAELAETTKAAEKAEQAHEKAAQRLKNENFALVNQGMTLAGTVSAAEKATQQAQAKAQELADKLGPMETTNAELKAARDRLAGLVDDIEAAAAAGDLATVQDLLRPGGDGPGLRV